MTADCLYVWRAGADIMMALDDVVPATATDPARFEEATYRTTRWIDRCIAAHARCGASHLALLCVVWSVCAWTAWRGRRSPHWRARRRALLFDAWGAPDASVNRCRRKHCGTRTQQQWSFKAHHSRVRRRGACLDLPFLAPASRRPTEQSLFGIVQGGLDPRLRRISAAQLVERDLPG